MDEGWHDVCAATALGDGEALHFKVGTTDVLLLRIGGALFAVDNLCTHAAACLHEGRIRGYRIICPLHGASFDARSGAVLGAPATVALRRHEVREADGAIFVRLA